LPLNPKRVTFTWRGGVAGAAQLTNVKREDYGTA